MKERRPSVAPGLVAAAINASRAGLLAATAPAAMGSLSRVVVSARCAASLAMVWLRVRTSLGLDCFSFELMSLGRGAVVD
jgi:hypothetical protein